MIHVVLVEPQIPPNTGNIARLCAAFKLPLHLVGKLGFSIDDKQLKRAGLDYWPEVNLTVHDSLKELKGCGRMFYFTTKSKRPYTEIRYEKGDYLVFGSETTGLPVSLLEKNREYAVTIPMTGRVRSLNLSSAVAMAAGEALRQVKG
ncbi:MAG: tRNA (cytidine(34)-2'-O)-methyltransferase [Deltaproteobacteria bacterium]|nr:tRNA (cytidine(34)-2'-O)-methyltransferase [Deltaproteobacteria bacterium]